VGARARCNEDWNALTHKRYCSSEAQFNATTVGQLYATQKWTRDVSDVNGPEWFEGLNVLWNVGEAMLKHHPKGIHILVQTNFAWDMNNHFIHHPMWIQQYVEFAKKAGIDYTAYYPEYAGMRKDLPKLQHLEEASIHIADNWYQTNKARYVSSKPWRTLPALKPLGLTTSSNFNMHIMFACMVSDVASCNPTKIDSIEWDLEPKQGVMAQLFRKNSPTWSASVLCVITLMLVTLFLFARFRPAVDPQIDSQCQPLPGRARFMSESEHTFSSIPSTEGVEMQPLCNVMA